MATIHKSDVTGRETEDEDEMHTLGILEDGIPYDTVDVHEEDHPDEIQQALAEMLQSMSFDHYGEDTDTLGDLFG